MISTTLDDHLSDKRNGDGYAQVRATGDITLAFIGNGGAPPGRTNGRWHPPGLPAEKNWNGDREHGSTWNARVGPTTGFKPQLREELGEMI